MSEPRKQFQWTTPWVLLVMAAGILGVLGSNALYNSLTSKNSTTTSSVPIVSESVADANTADTYPTEYETNFLNSCEQTSGGNTAACGCALIVIEDNYTYQQAAGFETQGIPADMTAMIQSRCF